MRTLRTLLVAAGLVLAAASPAAAAPPSTDHLTNAQAGAAWLASQVKAGGYLESPYTPGVPDLSLTAQAVPAFVAAGVGGDQVTAIMGYLAGHVDELVSDGTDDKAGSLANLILAVVASGGTPTAFGTPSTDLVARLQATERTTGTDAGLFGVQDPTYDGAYRDGLALLALHAAGVTPDAAALSWLAGQQCTAPTSTAGLWTAYRADTTVDCPVVDPNTFAGPDTNSTAAAMLGLGANGDTGPLAAAVTGLDSVRYSDGGFGYLARSDQPTDANSTGLVADALRLANGAVDAQAITALESLQVGCDGAPADQGGVAFQPQGTSLFPDAFATEQAIGALAGATLPVTARQLTAGVPVVCAPPPTTTTTTSTTAPAVVAAAEVAATTTTVVTSTNGLARTGSDSGPLAVGALALIGAGTALVVAGSRRERRSTAF